MELDELDTMIGIGKPARERARSLSDVQLIQRKELHGMPVTHLFFSTWADQWFPIWGAGLLAAASAAVDFDEYCVLERIEEADVEPIEEAAITLSAIIEEAGTTNPEELSGIILEAAGFDFLGEDF